VKRRTPASVAAGTAFNRRADEAVDRHPSRPVELRIHWSWQAFVAGFPGAVGLVGVWSDVARPGPEHEALWIFSAILAGAVALLVLGLASFVRLDGDRLTVRFYGVRRTTVRLDALESATFGMLAASISYAISLVDRSGRRVRFHANWWHDEPAILVPICQGLLDHDVAMDRQTTRIVSRVLGVRRPKPRIVHHGLLRKDRTW